jgi:hypothetical protein
VPAEGDFWVSAQVQRPGRQIELLSAEMLGPGPDGRPGPVARASGWRLQQLDTADAAHAAAPPLRPVSEGRNRNLEKNFDRNYVHSLDWRWLTEPLNDGAGESWFTPTVDLVHGEAIVAVGTAVRGSRRRQRHRHQAGYHQVHIPQHRSGRARAPDPFRRLDRDTRGNQLRADGIGTTIWTLFDERGASGGIQQSVLMRRRTA